MRIVAAPAVEAKGIAYSAMRIQYIVARYNRDLRARAVSHKESVRIFEFAKRDVKKFSDPRDVLEPENPLKSFPTAMYAVAHAGHVLAVALPEIESQAK